MKMSSNPVNIFFVIHVFCKAAELIYGFVSTPVHCFPSFQMNGDSLFWKVQLLAVFKLHCNGAVSWNSLMTHSLPLRSSLLCVHPFSEY